MRKLKDESSIFKKSIENEKKIKKYAVGNLENIDESDEELHDSVYATEEKKKELEGAKPKPWTMNLLKFHKLMYNIQKRRFNEEKSNNFGLYRAKERFINNLVNCVKYNYSLEESVQNFSTFSAFIQLIGQYFKLIIKKPIEDPQYVLQSDPKEVEKIIKERKEDREE